MLYPLDLSHRDKGAVPILEVARDLHMVCNGSSDVIPSSDVPLVVTYLRLRCQHWTPTPDPRDSSFDSAVLALLQAAIAEGDRWIAARDRDQAEDDELEPAHPEEPSDLNWDEQPGCSLPDHCLVIGVHRHGDCHTACTVDAHDQAMRVAESADQS